MKIKQSVRDFVRTICFLCIFLAGLTLPSYALKRETVKGQWNYTTKVGGFYQQEDNSIEVIALGSSHMYCSMIPNELWNSAGINSYILATQEQELSMTYYYLREALKTQTPKVIILETHMFNFYKKNVFKDAVGSNAIEPMRWSFNKLEMIQNVIPSENRYEFYVPLLKYHSNWSTWKQKDLEERYQGEMDPYRGFVFLTQTGDYPDMDKEVTIDDVDINEQDLTYLEKIIALLKEKDIPLLLFHAPSGTDDRLASSLAYLKEYAQENDVMFLDANEYIEEMEIDIQQDFFDPGHLNVYGAQKQTNFLSSYLQHYIKFDKAYSLTTRNQLQQEYEYYLSEFSE